MMSKTKSKIAVAVATQTALTRVIRGGLGSGVVGCAGPDSSGLSGWGEVGSVVMHLPSLESIQMAQRGSPNSVGRLTRENAARFDPGCYRRWSVRRSACDASPGGHLVLFGGHQRGQPAVTLLCFVKQLWPCFQALVTHLWAVSGGCAAGERRAHAAEIEHGKGDKCFG